MGRTSREKTTIPVNVPLLSKARALIDKYRLNIKALEKGYCLSTLIQLENEQLP
jgi:hypothetical protein